MTWIKINEQMPEEGQRCLLPLGNKLEHWAAEVGVYNSGRFYIDGKGHYREKSQITYWAPAPPPVSGMKKYHRVEVNHW